MQLNTHSHTLSQSAASVSHTAVFVRINWASPEAFNTNLNGSLLFALANRPCYSTIVSAGPAGECTSVCVCESVHVCVCVLVACNNW